MAESQKIIAPKEKEEKEEEEEEEERGEEQRIIDTSVVVVEGNPRSELPTIVLPDFNLEEAVFRDEKSQSETLASTSFLSSSLENNHDSNCTSFSQLLLTGDIVCCSSVDSLMEGSSVAELDVKPKSPTTSLKGSLELPSGYQVFPFSTRKLIYSYTRIHLQMKATSSTSNPISLQQRSLPVLEENNFFKPEVNEQKSFDQKNKPVYAVMRTPSTDGYNWRKYGQKQVKSTESSRSYYRCTHVNCHAKKKVERCDHSGHIIEIIYKGRHNHDPPRKVRCTKSKRLISSGPGVGSTTMDDSLQKLKYSDPSPSRKETRHVIPEQQLISLGKCEQKVRVKVEENQGDEPDAKRRIQDSSVSYSFPLLKTIKEPKIVVQAASDVGISGDGYRWRKYGQKIVKGNPNPRSYYKCTSAGCPVRKHVERSMDDTTAVIITYEGQHDHDMPVPKKRHGPPSAALVIAAAAAMNSAQLKKSEALTTQSANEKKLERGGEKVLESARTLLSIGIELKPH